MNEYAEIVGYKEIDKGTKLSVVIPEKTIGDYLKRFAINGIVKAELRLDDGRTISAEQRKKLYATVKDIAVHTGYMPEEMKELMKYSFIEDTGDDYFSLSNCSMTTARFFINHLIEFSLQWDIPLQESGLNRTDDIDRYLWACIKYKRCCLCGKKAEIHHWDTVGANGGRKYDDSKLRKIALCGCHHRLYSDSIHHIGKDSFQEKHHVYGIIFKK